MRLHNGSAISLTLLASSLSLVQASGHEQQATYPSYKSQSGYSPISEPEAPVQEPRPEPPSPKLSYGNASRADAPKPGDGPELDVNDPRFFDFRPPQAGDSRSACPGLNSLANHGFLPRNGKQMNATDMVLACYHGLGMSPETCSIITLSGLVQSKSSLDLVFDLKDTHKKSWGIEHDCSFSRKDRSQGDFVHFDGGRWDVALAALDKCQQNGRVDAQCLGSARAARIKDERTRNPGTNYNDKAAGHGAVEVARMILTMGDKKKGAELKYIKSMFEEERLPSHLGWKPKPYVAGVHDVLNLAQDSQKPDPEALQVTSNGIVANRIDIMTTLKSDKSDFLQEVKKLCIKSGFRRPAIFEALVKLDRELRQRYGEDFETQIDSSLDD